VVQVLGWVIMWVCRHSLNALIFERWNNN
jgi:hypothetical protein